MANQRGLHLRSGRLTKPAKFMAQISFVKLLLLLIIANANKTGRDALYTNVIQLYNLWMNEYRKRSKQERDAYSSIHHIAPPIHKEAKP